MKINKFYITFVLLVFVQILICNYVNLSPLVTLSILPVIILFLPVDCSCLLALILAFASGITVDFLSEGIHGLNALALVPVAYLRKPILEAVFGNGIYDRKENISYRKHGYGRIAIALALVQTIFLIIYIIADGAGTRPFIFNLGRFFISFFAGCLVSMLMVPLLTENNKQ